MRRSHTYLVAALLIGWTGQASAIALADCTRTTHVSHGGEAFHRDLGEGRVIWLDWWSQEGTALDVVIADCGPGAALRFRTAEENMNARLPFNKTEEAARIVEKQHEGSRIFASLPRLSEALRKVSRDRTILTLTQEPCACAALYPELRGDKTEFKLDG